MATIGVFAFLRNDNGDVLCVRQNYPPFEWTLPGGRVEPKESPLAALYREVQEETRCRIEVRRFIGSYAQPYADDLALVFEGRILERAPWEPTSEIAALGFFPPTALPQPMNFRYRLRIADAVAGRTGVVRVFGTPDSLLEGFPPV